METSGKQHNIFPRLKEKDPQIGIPYPGMTSLRNGGKTKTFSNADGVGELAGEFCSNRWVREVLGTERSRLKRILKHPEGRSEEGKSKMGAKSPSADAATQLTGGFHWFPLAGKLEKLLPKCVS